MINLPEMPIWMVNQLNYYIPEDLAKTLRVPRGWWWNIGTCFEDKYTRRQLNSVEAFKWCRNEVIVFINKQSFKLFYVYANEIHLHFNSPFYSVCLVTRPLSRSEARWLCWLTEFAREAIAAKTRAVPLSFSLRSGSWRKFAKAWCQAIFLSDSEREARESGSEARSFPLARASRSISGLSRSLSERKRDCSQPAQSFSRLNRRLRVNFASLLAR